MSAAPDRGLYGAGVRFECTGCGDCCRARGTASYVYVTLPERRQLAAHLGIPTATFTRRYCATTGGFHHLKEPASDCLFLDGARCGVYEARPKQCRTWPFWPEHFESPRTLQKLQRECPGVGHGRTYSEGEIEVRFAEEWRRESRD